MPVKIFGNNCEPAKPPPNAPAIGLVLGTGTVETEPDGAPYAALRN